MNYPVWDVPIIGSGWVIGMIAIFHVMISHFAVGGGLYLPLAERRALKAGQREWLPVLRRHSQFFLILTGVFGAVSGVGIWFAIGLASPEGTSTLIHNFVFGWAIEWVFFMVELSCAAVYYYTWDRISDRAHLRVGWVYAAASILTLVIINGILAFMLTPGETWLSVAGTGDEASKFWNAFFNPTYWPSLFLRTLVCVSLAGVWALVTASRIDGLKFPRLKTDVIRWSVMWLIPSFLLMPIFFFWYVEMVPDTHRDLLQLGISTIGQGTFTQVTRSALITIMSSATILGVAYFIAYRNPRDFRFGYACSIVFLALLATASTEHAREMLRKPFVVGSHMYSNGVRVSEVQGFNANGYLKNTPWVTDEEHAAWTRADIAIPDEVRLVNSLAPESPTREILARGELMFKGQCLACHTVDGYRSIRRLLQERDQQSIRNIVGMLHEYPEDSPYRSFMPPIVGTDAEVEALVLYLDKLVHVAPDEAPADLDVARAGK